MLLRDDVVTDRQTQAGALAGRLGREEGLEQLVPDLGRNARAVVAHRDLDHVPPRPRRQREGRPELGILTLALSPGGRIEAVAEQVEEDAGDLLRRYLDQRETGLEIALKRSV